MKITILHDSQFGNGKALAEFIAEKFSPFHPSIVMDVKQTTTQEVLDGHPDMVIIGSAIRGFHHSDKMNAFFKDLTNNAKNQKVSIPFGACFFTHALDAKFCNGWGKHAVKTLQTSKVFDKVYPEWFEAQVADAKGPFKSGEKEKFEQVVQTLINWMKS